MSMDGILLTIDEILASPHWGWFCPKDPPDLSDATALGLWIERVRGAAFLCGARHGQITEVEVRLLLPYIAAQPAKANKSRGRNGGLARAAKLSPERRSEIARNAALARWSPF